MSDHPRFFSIIHPIRKLAAGYLRRALSSQGKIIRAAENIDVASLTQKIESTPANVQQVGDRAQVTIVRHSDGKHSVTMPIITRHPKLPR